MLQGKRGPLVELTRESTSDPELPKMAQNAGSERDTRHLMRAVELAGEARGMTSPNPMVGAVIVKDGRVIGEGLHAAAGEPHAERAALDACSESPAGATLYVSLEPCCHTGRTPPCTEAIVGAGISRVVIASDDPTPKASGRGLGVLRDEGVAVEVLEAAGIATVTVTGENETARVGAALDELGGLEIQSLMVEGGPHLAGAFVDAHEVDEARVFVAPVIAGGRQSRSAVDGQGVELIG